MLQDRTNHKLLTDGEKSLAGPAGKGRIEVPRALNSAVECHLHTVEVTGSNPVAPTRKKRREVFSASRFSFRFSFRFPSPPSTRQIESLLDLPGRPGIAPFSPEELWELLEVRRLLPDEQDPLTVHRYLSPPGGNRLPPVAAGFANGLFPFDRQNNGLYYQLRGWRIGYTGWIFLSQARALTTPTPRASGLSAKTFLYPAARNREAISRAV